MRRGDTTPPAAQAPLLEQGGEGTESLVLGLKSRAAVEKKGGHQARPRLRVRAERLGVTSADSGNDRAGKMGRAVEGVA